MNTLYLKKLAQKIAKSLNTFLTHIRLTVP